jgi:7-cyano-7-deazaguanine reductase
MTETRSNRSTPNPVRKVKKVKEVKAPLPMEEKVLEPVQTPVVAYARTPALSNERPDGAQMIRNSRLERFENRTKNRKYWVEFTCPEFTCVCPASGFPDFATLHIRYQPKTWCVELKSLKLYINHYRDQGAFHEEVVNLILDDLVKLLDPWKMEIVGDFNVRGNIKTIVRARHKFKGKGKSEN